MTTTVEFITALFYEVDEQLGAIPKHPEAHLWPSEPMVLVSYKPIRIIVLSGLIVVVMHFLQTG